MPVSFWIFLIVCFVNSILVIKDHDEAWKKYGESKGNDRYKKRGLPGLRSIFFRVAKKSPVAELTLS